jgi:hypothetical protein
MKNIKAGEELTFDYCINGYGNNMHHAYLLTPAEAENVLDIAECVVLLRLRDLASLRIHQPLAWATRAHSMALTSNSWPDPIP